MTEQDALQRKKQYSSTLWKHPEVTGVGVGKADKPDDYLIVIFLSSAETPELHRQIKNELEGTPFRLITSRQFKFQTA